jgi:hypothetical protein
MGALLEFDKGRYHMQTPGSWLRRNSGGIIGWVGGRAGRGQAGCPKVLGVERRLVPGAFEPGY